jgi:hypothetical protein
MSAIERTEIAQVELVDDVAQFFAPVASDLIDSLIGQYRSMRLRIERVADFMAGPDVAGAMHHFESAARREDCHLSRSSLDRLFGLEGAIADLNAAYWSKAMHMTDVLDCMPQKRRDEWSAQIMNPLGKKKDRYAKEWEVEPIPEFTDEAVRSTFADLLSQRARFFAERVDGIFQALSKTHVTNAPEGFGKRMIVAHVDGHSKAGTINDLRCVVARFMGRDEPSWDATPAAVKYARQYKRGEWVTLDGGALRIRCYDIGTAHLEVHPDIAWRLNCVLAQLYPAAIPSKFRERPRKAAKEHRLMSQPLPFAVLSLLLEFRPAKDVGGPSCGWNQYKDVPGCWDLSKLHGCGDVAASMVGQILESIGGTQVRRARWAFDYDPTEVVKEIIASGCVPEQKSHQFYPTPRTLAERLVEFAEIGDGWVLEPSAGTGGIADLLPKERTTCVEISPLHCKVLEAKGHKVEQADFLAWAASTSARFDHVVMNPPFSDGRWQAHLQAAASLLTGKGAVSAILPSGAKARAAELLPGFELSFQGPFDNQFPGASVSVVLLKARKAA